MKRIRITSITKPQYDKLLSFLEAASIEYQLVGEDVQASETVELTEERLRKIRFLQGRQR